MRINTMKIAWILTVLGFIGILWWIWKYRIFEKAEEYQIIPDEWNHGVQPFREPRREQLAREPIIRGYEPISTPISTLRESLDAGIQYTPPTPRPTPTPSPTEVFKEYARTYTVPEMRRGITELNIELLKQQVETLRGTPRPTSTRITR